MLNQEKIKRKRVKNMKKNNLIILLLVCFFSPNIYCIESNSDCIIEFIQESRESIYFKNNIELINEMKINILHKWHRHRIVLDNIYFFNKDLNYATTYIVGIDLIEKKYILSDLYKVEILNNSDIYINKVNHLVEDYLKENINLLDNKSLIVLKKDVESFLISGYIKSSDKECNIRYEIGTKIDTNTIISRHMRIYNYYNKYACYEDYISSLKRQKFYEPLKKSLNKELEEFFSSKRIEDYLINEFIMISDDRTFGILPVLILNSSDSITFNSINFMKFKFKDREKIELALPDPILLSYSVEKLSSNIDQEKYYLEHQLKSFIAQNFFMDEDCNVFETFINEYRDKK